MQELQVFLEKEICYYLKTLHNALQDSVVSGQDKALQQFPRATALESLEKLSYSVQNMLQDILNDTATFDLASGETIIVRPSHP